MQNGTKYVPPHLRKSQSSGVNQQDTTSNHNNTNNNNDQVTSSTTSSHKNYNNNNQQQQRSSSFNNNNSNSSGRNSYGGSGGGRGGGSGNYSSSYNNNTNNSRWNNNNNNDGGGNAGRTSSFNMSSSLGNAAAAGSNNNSGGGSGRYYQNNHNSRMMSSGHGGPMINERGFHGDMHPDKRLEQRLFDNTDKQSTGINFDNYDKIPCEVTGDNIPDPIETYTVDTIGDDLYRNIQLCNYTRPTPVQKYSIPIGQMGRDLMACAQTGSGKTAGFLFPIIMAMIKMGGQDHPSLHDPTHRKTSYPHALVLAPTRELAQQIYSEAVRFTYCTGIACVCIYGGADIRDQLRQIERGCDLLVATPGRLVDLIERGRIAMHHVRFLVLDEADRMLDMGFEPQIRRIVEEEGMPAGDDRQTMMFSATFPHNIQRLASDFLREYVYLTVGRVGSASKDVTQTVEFVEEKDKMDVLMKFLWTIQDGLILIFVETKKSCDYIEDVLCANDFPACSIHGDKSQSEREEALRAFKRGDTPVMVGTDVASRGLDIPNVTQVINFDLPNTIDDYVHRIGRTGRAGNTGSALSFVNEKNVHIIRELRDMLAENDQVVPPWLNQMVQYAGGNRSSGSRGRGSGRGGGGRGGSNSNSFGSRDVRYAQTNNSGGGGRDSARGGGGGGGYGGGYGGGGGYGSNNGNFGSGAW